MDIKDQKDVKIILCACKKYREEQNNGILILNSKIEENKKLNPNFINTNNFEVNCFCPIKIKINNKMEKTNYFFAGGFESDSKQGLIKLYEVIYKKSDDNKENIEIIFLQDVEFDNNGEFQGFQRTVNCIFQNKSNGKILVSCWDGNIYLFSPPNLEFYLNENVNNITKILKEN